MYWVILVLKAVVALAFTVSGAMKLKGTPSVVALFEEFGFPPAWMYAVGILELVGALGLFLGPDPVWACLGLSMLMMGAVVNHLKVGHPPSKWRPAVSMLGLCVILALLIAGQGG